MFTVNVQVNNENRERLDKSFIYYSRVNNKVIQNSEAITAADDNA